MAMMLPPDFKEFLKLLKEHDVQYLLIGGYAVGYRGSRTIALKGGQNSWKTRCVGVNEQVTPAA